MERRFEMSDTPETDAFLRDLNDYSDVELRAMTEHARRLERERDEATTRRMETIMQCELYEQERDEARFLLKAAQSALDAIHLEVGGWIKKMKENTD
jgi:hypothetical protein